tara:strand:+ start:320 stop:556 length:237 start_codon:yes stop_codon:yes gene_type:complete
VKRFSGSDLGKNSNLLLIVIIVFENLGNKKSQWVKLALKNGVDDGARTHDKQNHNLLLYQLNYAHHKLKVFYIDVTGI